MATDARKIATSAVADRIEAQAAAQAQAVAMAKLEAELVALRAENARLAAKTNGNGRISLKVSEKGALSVYGLGRFPTTLYAEQWTRLLAEAETIKAFMAKNAGTLAKKADKA